MDNKLTAGPGSLEFLIELYEIARQSTHPMDKALTTVLEKQIGETEALAGGVEAGGGGA